MELTPGILKSVDSAFHQNHNFTNKYAFWILKYRGQIMKIPGSKPYFTSEGRAKKYVYKFVYCIFWHGEYWQSCKRQIKDSRQYEVDYSATIKILPQYGPTARFDTPEAKKMFKDIADNLLKEKIITIEKVFEI